MKLYVRLLALLAIFSLVAAACGDDASEDDQDDQSTETEDSSDDDDAMEDEDGDAMEDEDGDAMDEDAHGSLLIWADENRVGPIESVAVAFTEETGVEVNVELVPFGDISEQVQQAAPAGEGPDIFIGAHDWAGALAANGVIAPIDLSAVSDNLVPATLDAFNLEGQTYALPTATEAIALYHNTDLVPDAPATWDDMVAACEANNVTNCIVVPGGGDGGDAFHNYPFVSGFGGGIFAFDPATGYDASDVRLDSAETIEGIQFLADQVSAGVINSTNYDDAKNLWLEGEAAFWMTGPWELGNVQEQTTVPNWAVTLIPEMGNGPAQPFLGVQGFYLSSFSENELLAQSFLLDFVATDDVMQALYDADPRGSGWNSVLDGLADDPIASVFATSAANGVPMPNIPQMGAVWGPLGDNILLVRNGESDGETAMTTAAEAVRAAIEG